MFAAIGHNLGNIVLNSTDNIVVSKFVGLVMSRILFELRA